jgi:MFS family permease
VVLLGYCFSIAGVYAALAGLVALIPDQVPPEQRGLVSGVMGMGLPIGAIGGTFIVQAVSASTSLMFMVPAAVTLVTCLLLALVVKDRRLDRSRPLPPFSLKEFLKTFYVSPRHNPDFAWIWLSRFLFIMGIVTLTNYQPFFLTDRLGIGTEEVAGFVFISTLIHYVFVAALSVPSGWASDRVGRRKVFVLSGALLFAAGLAVVALADSFNIFLVGMVIAGIGEGIYIAVDLALVTDVLPDSSTAAKDLGVFNVASSLPQPLAPALAPLFLAIPVFTRNEVGGNYTALFIVAALLVFAGALAIRPVKSVR